MRGHDLFDGVVGPMLGGVCEALRRERERDIRRLAGHEVQLQNELSAYRHAVAPVEEMLRKHTGYENSEPYRRVQDDIRRFLERGKATPPPAAARPAPPAAED